MFSTTLLLLLSAFTTPPAAPVKVVTSLTTYASIAREIVGDRGTVASIAQGDEDPHFVQPKPSFVALLRGADLFVTTGMDLELWVPTLLDRAGNRKIMPGSPGYVSAHDGIALLEVPASVSRAGGDVHADGNPHIHTDPINGIIISRNILAGLSRVDPANAEYYRARQAEFERKVLEATIGTELVGVLTPATAFNLLQTGQFDGFVAKTMLSGKPLADKLGGWLKAGKDFRGREMACYHKEWSYFSVRFQVTCVAYIEAKPGLPPTPGHVEEVIAIMKSRQIPALFASNYYPQSQVEQVASKTGASAVVVAENTLGAPGITTYFDLVNQWVTDLAAAFRKGS